MPEKAAITDLGWHVDLTINPPKPGDKFEPFKPPRDHFSLADSRTEITYKATGEVEFKYKAKWPNSDQEYEYNVLFNSINGGIQTNTTTSTKRELYRLTPPVPVQPEPAPAPSAPAPSAAAAEPVCTTPGCGRPTWNGQSGEQCCRVCPKTSGKTHGDHCQKSAGKTGGTSGTTGSGSAGKVQCKTAGCGRVTWNGQEGEECCKSCGKSDGKTHGDHCEKMAGKTGGTSKEGYSSSAGPASSAGGTTKTGTTGKTTASINKEVTSGGTTKTGTTGKTTASINKEVTSGGGKVTGKPAETPATKAFTDYVSEYS